MSSSSSRVALLGLLSVALAFGTAKAAEAKGLPLIIINTGDVFYKVADLPEELASNPDLQGWSLGYKASHFGILWADIACWNKELVVFKDNTYSDLPPDLRDRLAAQYPWSSTKRNPWTRFGAVLMIGGLGAGKFLKRGA